MKFKIGDKIRIPKTKSIGDDIKNSIAIKMAKEKKQNFLYFNGISGERFLLHCFFELNNGDFFSESDLEIYSKQLFLFDDD